MGALPSSWRYPAGKGKHVHAYELSLWAPVPSHKPAKGGADKANDSQLRQKAWVSGLGLKTEIRAPRL